MNSNFNFVKRVITGTVILGLTISLFSVVGLATVDLQFLSLAWQPATVRVVRDIVREWNAANPDIQVEIVWQTWEGVNKFLLTSFLGGDAPDIFHQDAVMCYEYGAMGFAAPLNEYLDEETLADIPARMWDSVTCFDGTIYGIPFLWEPQVVFYNRALFEERGITLPEDAMLDWDELLDTAKRLTERDEYGNVTTWGLLAPLMERFQWTLIRQNDGHVLHRQDDGTWYVQIDEGAREALDFYVRMVTDWEVMSPEVIGIDFTSMMRGFLGGRYAMVVFGSWNRSFILRMGRDFRWGMLKVTGPKRNVTAANPQALGIWKDSPHRAEAFEFARFFTNAKNSARIAYGDWLFPTRESALADPKFSQEEHQWDLAKSWLQYAEDVMPAMPFFLAFDWRIFVPKLEMVILGHMSFDDALAAMEREGNRFLWELELQ